jgi:hypothetical protein
MTPQQAKEISEQIRSARDRYNRALDRASGTATPKDLEAIILETWEVNEDIQSALHKWRELSKQPLTPVS